MVLYKHAATVGYGISCDSRRRGLATEALRLVTAYGFNEFGLVRISGMYRADNDQGHNDQGHNAVSARV